MGCVNRNGREFRALAARNNVAINTLELYTHKYWIETGNETLLPTDIYIQQQLGYGHYKEPGKSVRKLWELKYSSPQEFIFMRSLQSAIREAERYFPKSAISYYKNAKNNFVLVIKRPVEKEDYSKDAFFKDYDNLGSMKDVPLLNLGIKENQSYGINKVRELFNRFNTDKTSKDLADRAFNIAEELGLQISFVKDKDLEFGKVGRYSQYEGIKYKKSFLERDMMNDKKATVLLHEVLHALSLYALSDTTKDWKRPEALEAFRTEMNSLYQELKDNPILKGERGVVDLREFVAELANPVFRAKIQNIDRESNATKQIEESKENVEKKSSFWSRVINAFKRLLNLHVTNTYYQRSMNALDKALNAFDIDTYMRYSGIKNQLREGYNAKDWEFNSMTDIELKEKVGNYFEKEAIDNTINTENQRIENKNNTQYEEAVKSAGRTFESTFNILGNEQSRVGRSSKEKASTGKSLREQLHEESSRQQKELISWATKNNQLVVEPNDYYEEKLGDSLSGSETKVWRKGNTVLKNISLNHYSTPKALMDRILIHNMAFPTTAMTMQKVGTSDKGISIVVEQPLIVDSGTIPTMQEIEDYMVTQGFTHTKGKGVNAEWSKDNYIVSDIRPENVIKQPDGTLAVIDCFAMFKPEAATLSPRTSKEFIKTLTGKQLKDELGIIKQESADYDLINDNVEIEPGTTKEGQASKATEKDTNNESRNTSPITKIISGGQTGVDTIGLQVAKKLGIETGGKASKGFLRERGIDLEDIASYGLTEISDAEQSDYTNRKGKKDPYTGRTELNVRNSDGTVYFATDDDSAGRIATERSAKEWNKPFLLNPTAQQLREWIITNNIRTLNIAGNRGSKLPTNNKVASIIEEALTTKEKATETTKPTITKQVVDHLKSIPGINVLDRSAMEEFLKTHNIAGLQQAIAEQKEMDAIKQKAIADGTFMKAPNGKPTNLNERQWLQVRTTNFKKWFGDWENNPQEASKVVDENGEPLVMFRTDTEGKTIMGNDENSSFYASNKIVVAGSYGHEGTDIYLGFVNLRNPFIVKDKAHGFFFTYKGEETDTDKIRSTLIKDGYDGVLFERVWDVGDYGDETGETDYWAKNVAIFYKNQFKSATDNNGNFSLTDDNIQAAFKIDNSNINDSLTDVDKEDILREVKKINRAKRTLIDTGGDFLFLVDHTDREGLKHLQEGQEGFLCKAKIDITGLSKEQINEIKNNYEDDRGSNEATKGLEHWIERNRYSERYLNSDSIDAEDRKSATDNVGLDSQAQEGKSVRGQGIKNSSEDFGTGQIKTGFDGTNGPRYMSVEGIENFLTPQGEVYGFVDKEGNIYLDETKISPNHPIHEYTHLWDRTVQKKNPKLWQKGIELMKQVKLPNQTLLWDVVLNDKNYGKQWQSMNLPKEKLESLIASEVHARLVGENGEKLLDNLAKQKGQEGIIGKLKQWILDMWKEVKATFGNWSQEDLDNLKLKDFNHMTVRDFVEGTNLHEASDATYTKKNTTQETKEAEPAVEQPSLPEDTAQMVSLPGYESFKDYYDDIPVDAEWKVPYLKELDAQLSTELSPEENQNIITQMDKILQATSEVEYKQELSNTKEKKVQKTLDEYDKLNAQINNLLEGNKDLEELGVPIPASEIRHTAELIANQISDLITQLQQEEGLAEKQYPTLQTKLDFQKASRKEIVEAVGIERLIERVKVMFDTEKTEYRNLGVSCQADVIFDNWDAMIYLAADVFAMNEGFGITKDFTNGRFSTTERTNTDFDNFNDYSNDLDYERENEGKDEQEHWQIETKTIDVLSSMSALVRKGLHECYLLDKEGNKVISKWGIAERINPRSAVNSILRWTRGSLSLQDMIDKLSTKEQTNPWLSQLTKRLSDKSGNETDFQSQFYGVFSKPFQLYSIVLLEDGKYHSILVNSHPARSEAMHTITAQFKIGQHPLFNEHKVNGKLLGSKDTVGEDDAFNLYKASAEIDAINKRIKYGETITADMAQTVRNNVLGACRILGYNITEDIISDIANAENIAKMAASLNVIVRVLSDAKKYLEEGKLKNYDPFKYYGECTIGSALRNFLTPVVEQLEDTTINAFYDSGKMYQSYVTPSFMTRLLNKFKLPLEEFREFMMKEYGSSQWFRTDEFNFAYGWKNVWLDKLAFDPRYREMFDHKVELNFNKHNYMKNMSDAEYALSMVTEYFSESSLLTDDGAPSWYRMPMQSNKPSSEYIKFFSYRGHRYKEDIANGLLDMFFQEISRIQTVRRRNLTKDNPSYIKNFDENGKKFCFLPAMNGYLENTVEAQKKRIYLETSEQNDRLAELLQKKVEGVEDLTSEEAAELNHLAHKAIQESVEQRVQSILDKWEKEGILEAAKKIKGMYDSDLDRLTEEKDKEYKERTIKSEIRDRVENFLWNDAFASKNILQLTITDIAFYKDTEDLQKRLAQLHAPGTRANIEATDYKGNRVSDGYYRTFILKDFDGFKSNIIANIAEVFDRKIDAAPDNQKAALRALKESLVGEKGKYRQINVTDAQGYSSPSSYRKKALMFGKWSKEAEEIYQRIASKDYKLTDLEVAFQPLKPFVYTKLTKSMEVDNAPIQSMQVPFQAKNSEYLLIMADALLQGEELSRPNLLRAVYRVMEDSEKFNPTKGIDTVQFESAIKSGLQGRIDISKYREMEGGEEAAYTCMMHQIFKDEVDPNTGKRVFQTYNTDTFIHETSYDDYCLQQEVPEHFKDHAQSHGSQIRMIIPSDLDYYTTDENGNQVENYYEWIEPDPNNPNQKIKRRVKADEFKKEYEQTIADNIEESIIAFSAELGLNSIDRRERNIALSKVLQREILSSPRYGVDLVQACSIDKGTGEFRIPKGDPIQAKRIEQLINSIIKNRINKQTIKGGPIVQVTNFGTSKQLHIRFNDKQGNLMPLEEEYKSSEHGGMSYKEYCKKHQGGIAYFEVFAPAWSNDIFNDFANPDGTINIEALEAVAPELLKMVSYRIPTEDKYSCAPMKVVGFLPRWAGDGIMLPYELTEIDDSDFDVDKRYVMRKDIPIKTKEVKGYIDDLTKKGEEIYKELFGTDAAEGYIDRMVNSLVNHPKKFNVDSSFRKSLYTEYLKLSHYTNPPTSGRKYRDNKIVDMSYAVLSNEMTADKILNPGGFEAPKKVGYMIAAYKSSNNTHSWEDLQAKSVEDLKELSYTDKDITFADTQVQFYKQNAAAASLIGVFAVNKIAHATLESDDIYLNVGALTGGFTIGDVTFDGLMEVDPRSDNQGNLIGKTLGSLVSASADAVKDPILNLMNINMTTAGMLTTLLRLRDKNGNVMSFEDAALFLSQDIIERTLNKFNKDSLTSWTSIDRVINEWLDAYRKANNVNEYSLLNTEPLTKEDLITGLTSEKHSAIDYKVLLAFQKLNLIVGKMRNLTYVTRFNSISSAVGPLIVDNLIMRHKMNAFLEGSSAEGTYFYADQEGKVSVDMTDIFENHPILNQFSKTVDIAEALFSDMPAGSTGFKEILNKMDELGNLASKMYSNRKLLSDFSDFYQSYLLVQSGVIDQKDIKYYVEDFTKEFMEKYKDKYADNALVKAIQMNVSKASNRPFLTINITGMDEAQKEEFKSAWIDLHKVNPELSRKLFNYCFFRGGIGFTPKTFMSLVPTFVKERLKSKDGKNSYVDTYRVFPEVIAENVIDQFVRNNWDNDSLVPRRGGKNTKYDIDYKHGRLIVYRPEDQSDLIGLTYIKTGGKNSTRLWKLVSSAPGEAMIYKGVKSLGNNGEYLEIYTNNPTSPVSTTTQVQENNSPSALKENAPVEDSANNTPSQPISETKTTKQVAELARLVLLQNPNLDAYKKIEEMKENPQMYKKFLVNVFKQGGLNLNDKEAVEKFKEMC